MTKIKSASFTRYARVLKILQGDPHLSKKLSKTMVAICRPDQSIQDFPQEVVYVVEQLHLNNLDANSCKNRDVLQFAFKLLENNTRPITFNVEPEPEAPVEKEKKKPVAKVKKPKAKVKALVESEDKAQVEKAPAPTRVKAKVKRVAKAKAEPAPEKPIAVKPVEPPVPNVTSKIIEFVRPHVPFVVGCAMLSNFQAGVSLLEPYVQAGDTDAKELSQKINVLIDDIHRRIEIPNAKESSETPAG